ncbi:unnamed protein product [Fraxinus pennsylvanica]|uniref:peroxidase n=1 Tax=Fraxinus pennsylvanica TaxID=56036 RepID=A0AAD1YWI0_9LAMI|nr:unnamed protein product [Fraxinus pennsylvanica]
MNKHDSATTNEKSPLEGSEMLTGTIKIMRTQLDYKFYDNACLNFLKIVSYGVWSAIANESRMAASILRLHFHDCFANSCDRTVLLDDTNTFTGETNTYPNKDSAGGFDIIDAIKANVEKACPSKVSCVVILTLSARESAYLIIMTKGYVEYREDSLGSNN